VKINNILAGFARGRLKMEGVNVLGGGRTCSGAPAKLVSGGTNVPFYPSRACDSTMRSYLVKGFNSECYELIFGFSHQILKISSNILSDIENMFPLLL